MAVCRFVRFGKNTGNGGGIGPGQHRPCSRRYDCQEMASIKVDGCNKTQPENEARALFLAVFRGPTPSCIR